MGDDPEIVAVEEQLRLAMLAGDVFVLNRLIDDDLAFVTYTGWRIVTGSMVTVQE